MNRKAIAVLYAPKDLRNLFGYYSAEGKEYVWTAILGTYTVSGAVIREECEKAGIFEKIIVDNVRYDTQNNMQKIKMFFKMSAWWMVGKQKELCDKQISRLIDISDYELIVIGSGEGGVLNGAFMRQASEKRVILLEDGLADYDSSASGIRISQMIRNINLLVSLLLAKMNYVDITGQTHLKSARQCEKYVCRPEDLNYTNYKSIHRLFDSEKTDHNLYSQLTKKTFDIDIRDLSGDVLLLTMPIYELGSSKEKYKAKVEQYINKIYAGATLIIKKHPRDDAEYCFEKCADVKTIPANIPGEIILGDIQCKEILIMRPGNLNGMCTNADYKVLHWSEFDDVKMVRLEKFGDFFRRLCLVSGVDASHIIEL